MKELSNAEKLQAVLNTLPLLEMRPTHDNAARMTGIYNTLIEVQNDLIREREADTDAGNNQAE